MKSTTCYFNNNTSFEEFDCISYTTINVLPFLIGKLWDDIALGYIHALRPSALRVSYGNIKCDARTWRVTVFLDKNNLIDSIEQEVEVGLPIGIEDGYALDQISGNDT